MKQGPHRPKDMQRHKVGIQLYADDMDILDELKPLTGLQSRSAVIRLAIRRLKLTLERGVKV